MRHPLPRCRPLWNRHQPKPRRSSLQNLPRAVLRQGRLETIPTTNSAFSPTPGNFKTGILVATDAPHDNSLLVENKNLRELLAVSIGAFGSRGHRLAAVRDHSATRGVIPPNCLIACVGQRVVIYLLYGNRVIR